MCEIARRTRWEACEIRDVNPCRTETETGVSLSDDVAFVLETDDDDDGATAAVDSCAASCLLRFLAAILDRINTILLAAPARI